MRQILDDRGDFVLAAWFTTDAVIARQLAQRARAAELKRELSRTTYRRTLQAMVLLTALSLEGLLLYAALRSGHPGAFSLLLAVTVPIAMVIWSALRLQARLQKELDRVWSATALTTMVCLRCRYPLKGLNPDPDGCTTCPECGAAWRLPNAKPQ